MLRIKTALATGLCLAATSLTASAGGPSYESRGYGGPLYIGPNFQQGGQHAPPTYGSGSSSSGAKSYSKSRDYNDERPARRAAKKKSQPQEDVAEKKKAPVSKPSETKAAETDDQPTKKAEAENSSITTAARTDAAEATGSAKSGAEPEAAASSGTGCRRFVAAVGAVITVPCD